MKVELPFPPSSLSGHNNGSWRGKSDVVKKHREWAFHATLAAIGGMEANDPSLLEGEGDIPMTIRFIPPNNRGDRINYPNRMKPYFDGIADALKVNDRRFNPMFVFCDIEKPGRVEVYISRISHKISSGTARKDCGRNLWGVEKRNGRSAAPTAPDRDQTLRKERSI